ncbi:hypothetical protein ACH4GK_17895 [Streptomyces rimosus]|uniref:hypothetical protein n=1 Tax=Streptomyces rimosus TaxID=1927 RepID=UPI0004CBC510|nr:hypothetical protein [Streptomyces rimosus]
MRVRARTALRPYYNYRLIDIPAGTEVSGGLAVHLLETRSDVEPADEAAALWENPGADDQPEEPGGGSEPEADGTADDILTWVGDDPDRADTAIAQETARDKPRSTLLKKLQKIAEQ